MDDEQRWTIPVPQVMWEVLDDEAVIVDLGSGHYHAASGVALTVWRAVDEGLTLTEIVTRARAIHPDAPSTAAAEVETFVLDLVARGLVQPVDSRAPTTRRANPDTNADLAPDATAAPWAAPVLESHDDLEDLLLLDPVHDVTSAGWPHAAPPAP